MNVARRLRRLRNAYRRLFWDGGLYRERVSDAAMLALFDLRRFCRADRSCVVFDKDGRVDALATAVLEGRHETWLKIVQILNLSDEQLIQIEKGGNNVHRDDDNE